MLICDKKECTGCSGCMNICPVNAIKMVPDELGKTIPYVDETKCIHCNKCKKICPNNNPISKNMPISCYAIWTKNEGDKKTCSSGGVATAFSRYVTKEQGVVFGAAILKSMQIEHIAIEEEANIEQLKGSKYVESKIGNSYRFVQNHLKEGRIVLFIGVPCQIQGLNQFLGKEYDNLITVDLICHGTPPYEYFKEYLNYLKLDSASDVTFRGYYDFCFTCFKGDKIIYQRPAEHDLYFLSFLSNLTQRDNCYDCKYSTIKRVSDITIGDFWGIDKDSLKNKYDGKISVALINTIKGEIFFNKVKELFTFEKRNINEAISGNEQLLHPSSRHKDREIFERNYMRLGFTKAVMKTKIPYQIHKSRVKDVITKVQNKVRHK